MIPVALEMLAMGAGLVFVLMLILWLIQWRTGNAGIVDIGWAAGLALIALVYAFNSSAPPLRTFCITAMAVIWGARLATHLYVRVVGKPEDGRYAQLRKDWAGSLQLRFFLFYQFQALLCVVFSVPFLMPMLNPEPGLNPLELAAVFLWLAAMAGETLADSQLTRFKSDPANKGRTCTAGLWRYSRHPNYFFEWLIWISFALFALASPYGYLAWIAPALMLYFLFKVTGIPATEAQALRSRGEEYRRYQRTTSAFFPWFPGGENAR